MDKIGNYKTPSPNQVEFKAYYIDEDGKLQIHHEFSTFQKMLKRWYYVSGKFLEENNID